MKPKISRTMRDEARMHAFATSIEVLRQRLFTWRHAMTAWKDSMSYNRSDRHHMLTVQLPAYNNARRDVIIYIMSLEIKLNRHRWYREEF